MARRRAVSVLSALGVSASDERLYQQVRPLSGTPTAGVAVALGVDAGELDRTLAGLYERRAARIEDGLLVVPQIPELVAAIVAREAAAAVQTQARLGELSRALPFLVASSTRPAPGEVEDLGLIDGEVSAGGNSLNLLTAMIEQSQGDLLFLRPDVWRLPRETALAQVVGRAVASGRRSRAIYDRRAFHEGADRLRARAEAGEEVRILDHLPTRLFVIVGSHAIVPEPLGYADEPRLLIRQGALVAVLALLFELYWERSLSIPELESEAEPDRTFLLRQLALGSKDEQIARHLGMSLRTVRRRVADLMIDLGVDTRFQAGAEAVRRGWL